VPTKRKNFIQIILDGYVVSQPTAETINVTIMSYFYEGEGYLLAIGDIPVK